MRRLAPAALLAVVAALVLLAAPAVADEGWVIDRFAADIEIQRDGTLNITESIDVDFLTLQDRHGIFRVIPVRYQWDADPKMLRVYDLDVRSVRDASGRSLTYETSEGGWAELQHPDRRRRPLRDREAGVPDQLHGARRAQRGSLTTTSCSGTSTAASGTCRCARWPRPCARRSMRSRR